MKTLARLAASLLAGVIGCSSSTEPERPITVAVVNELDVDVTIRAGSTFLGTLEGFDSVSVTLPAGVRTLEWQNGKRKFSNGTPMPDELSGATVSVSASTGIVRISNIVNGVPYFTPETFIVFADTVSFELARGGTTTCLGFAWGPSFLFGPSWGYYRLVEGTELRYYRGRTCRAGAAPYVFWGFNALSTARIGSGRISLTADRLP